MKKQLLAAALWGLAMIVSAQTVTTTMTPVAPVPDSTPNVFSGSSKIVTNAESTAQCLKLANEHAAQRPDGDYTYSCRYDNLSFKIKVKRTAVDVRPPKPGPVAKTNACPSGFTGTWQSFAGYYEVSKEQGWWALGNYEPKEFLEGQCTPNGPVTPPPVDTGKDVSITSTGAKCDGKTDDAPAIRTALTQAKAKGGYATVPADRTCAYGGVIYLDSMKLKGAGATSILASLNTRATAFWLRGDGSELRSLQIAGVFGPNREAPWEMTRVVLDGVKNFVVDSVVLKGSTAAGMQAKSAPGPGKITNNVVVGTLSDSIHMTDGAHDIEISGNKIDKSGDDGIAVVSYRGDGKLVSNIVVRGNLITGNLHGRGMSVVGGTDVLQELNTIENSGQYACVYISQETSYNTYGVKRVVVQRNTLKNCGSTATGHGAVMVFSQDNAYPNDDIRVLRNDIIQSGQNGIRAFGSQTNVVIDSNRIVGANPAYQLPASITAVPFTSGAVGAGSVVVQPPPVVVPSVEPPPVVPPVQPPAVTGLPYVNQALVPAAVQGSSTRDIATTSRQPARDGGGIGAFRTVCNRSHFNNDDPLVYPGQQGRSHLHVWFGNTGGNYASTVASIAGAGNGTCRGGIVNRSAYWAPALIDTDTGAPLEPGKDNIEQGGIDVYYKTGYHGVRDADVKPIPPGFRMITGDSKSRVYQDKGLEFACNGANYGRNFRTCNAGDWLHVRIEFPQCWNGRDLDSPDHKSHVAWATDGRGCADPAFPVPLLEVSYVLKYKVPAKGMASWRLSSDQDGTPPFSSSHADYWFGWEGDSPNYQGIIPAATQFIVNRGLSGGSDLVGDGRTIYGK